MITYSLNEIKILPINEVSIIYLR